MWNYKKWTYTFSFLVLVEGEDEQFQFDSLSVALSYARFMACVGKVRSVVTGYPVGVRSGLIIYKEVLPNV